MVRHRFRVEEDFHTQAHPGPEDGLLLVSLSAEAWDREKKLPLYAQAGLPEVWLLTREGLEVHRDPEGGRFLVAEGETIAPLLLPEAELLFQPL
ncbi:MAG: Uma2 family endonuclease [Thermus sp.]|uniref:Uma2 family endonuclease n=1 Tax=Thermus sp. TaxID=275 RepID=UPI003D121ABA